MPHNFQFTAAELRKLLVELICTRHVAQPLEACEADEDGRVVLGRMQARKLTLLGVRDRGQVVGSVDCRRLRDGRCRDQMQPIAAEQLIDRDASLLELLARLSTRHWLFVQEHQEINAFVSRSDLQRAPVRMLLFGMISMFELLLLDLVQKYYTEEELSAKLNANRLRLAQRLHAERQNRGEELHLADCLQIADKRDLLLAAEGCSRRLGFDSNNAAARFFVHVEVLRDRLVHANDLIAGSSWDEVIDTTLQLADFLERRSEGC